MRFAVLYSHPFGERVISNLVNEPGHCRACGSACDGCKYGEYSLLDDLVTAERLPGPEELPEMLEDPDEYLPELPRVDVLLAVRLHPDLLMELPERYEIRALIVPVEAPDWIDPWTEDRLREACEGAGVELTIARPGCDLEPPGPVTERFCERGRIGRPRLSLRVEGGVVVGAGVIRSAPCGCTWFVARRLVGVDAEPEAVREAAFEAHHSFPCTASMEVDERLGDTPLHVGARLHIRAALRALERALGEGRTATDK